MDETIETMRAKSTASLSRIREMLPVTKKVINLILSMQTCNDVDALLILGERGISEIILLKSWLNEEQYSALTNTILSVSDTEELRIAETEVNITLH